MSSENVAVPDATGDSSELSEIVGADVAPAMAGMMSRLVKNATREYREAHEVETSARRVADEESRRTSLDSTSRSFAKAWRDSNPDFTKADEDAMLAVAKKVRMASDGDPREYLDSLLALARKNRKVEAPKPEAEPAPGKKRSLREAVTGISEEVAMRRKPRDPSDENESFDSALESAWGSAFK